VTRAVFAARDGKVFGRTTASALPAAPREPDKRSSPGGAADLVGGPDTIVKQLKAFHDQCGVGVVDLGFQQTGTDHREVMQEIALFGREVLPRIKSSRGSRAYQ